MSSVFDLVNNLLSERRSGILHVNHAPATATLRLHGGKITDVQWQGWSSLSSFFRGEVDQLSWCWLESLPVILHTQTGEEICSASRPGAFQGLTMGKGFNRRGA